VDVLSTMQAYRFERVYMAPSSTPGHRSLSSGVIEVLRRIRAYDVLHVHGEVTSGLCLPLLAARPSVVTLHGLHLVGRLTGFRHSAATLNLRTVVRAAGRTICVSESEFEELLEVAGPRVAGRALVVRNGVRPRPLPTEAARAGVREELGLSESEPVAIWVGSLDERRDPLTVVRAAERASVSLLVVGDGPLRSQVERIAQISTRVLGHRLDVPRLLAAADFFVLMSRREGLSFALLEAMAHGLPAIVADIAANIEAIGDSGLAVPYGDEKALVAAFGRLLGKEGERAVLAERGRSRIAEFFDAEEMIDRTRAVYDGVLAGRPPR
jgi:glycosyltransferase involved in cell wall biosynthesis